MNDPDASELVARAREALAQSGRHIRAFDVRGARMFVKRLAPPHRHWFTTGPVRRFITSATGFAPLRLAPADIAAAWRPDFELVRLDAMARSGVRVARVLARAPDLFVLEDGGPDVARRLPSWSAAVRRRELGRLADDFAQLHRAGQWHGAAHIKNVTIDADGGFRRIDFEENPGALLPLPIVQAADLLQFLNTIALAGPIDERESESLLVELVERYFERFPSDGVRRTIRRGLPWLESGLGIAVLFGRRSSKGLRRARIEARVLAEAIGGRRRNLGFR